VRGGRAVWAREYGEGRGNAGLRPGGRVAAVRPRKMPQNVSARRWSFVHSSAGVAASRAEAAGGRGDEGGVGGGGGRPGLGRAASVPPWPPPSGPGALHPARPSSRLAGKSTP